MKEAQYNIKITYPDKEEVSYHYDPAGQLQAITTNLGNFIGAGANSTIVERILYNDLGERSSIKYGNGTITNYKYDARRRMNQLKHSFTGFQAERNYKYDALSNILGITTANATSPALGQLGGPVNHEYEYDTYNRLMRASGYYVGPDDAPPNMLKQAYSLNMTYDDAHNILEKHQVHQFGSVGSIGQNLPQNAAHAPLTSYKLEYGDYATGQHTAASQSYVQPHAPRTIIEYPNENFDGDLEDPRIRHKMIDYDANGNQLEIRERITDPAEPQGFREVPLKKHLWDEEDRLRAADLSPENDADKPLIAVYTYDASGERSIKYVPGRLDARYSAKEIGKVDRLESMLYPNPLLSAKSLPIPEMRRDVKDPKLISYTKHYYIGSERITSVIGSKRGLGAYPGLSETTVPLNLVEDIVDAAGTAVQGAVAHFGKTINLPQPYRFSDGTYNGSDIQDPENYAAFWYHPDHLGSSSYITNLAGEITQHMEYLPFGETLIEEHLNSNNSPYKFNAKEMDAETGNYYYGARYYSPKYNLMLSVDPLSEMFPGISPYVYVLNNPVRYIDPTGLAAENNGGGIGRGIRKVFNAIFHPNRSQLPDGRIERTGTKSGTSRATGWKHPGSSKSTTEDKNTSENRTSQETLASNLSKMGVNPQTFIPQIDVQLPNLSPINSSSFRFDDREITISGPQSVDFDFSTIGGTASKSTDGVRTGTNRILPMTNSQQQNLQAIANYLIANPQATIRFQYPTPLNSSHSNFNADLREVYQMNFSQMTNYLIQQGVTDPNRRVIMNYGKRRDFIVNPGN